MSRSRSAVTIAAVLAGFALLAALLLPSPGSAVVAEPPAVEVELPGGTTADLGDPLAADPFLRALLGEGTGLPANAGELSEAADLVCEGFTAEVPLVELADGIAERFGVDDTEARRFVNLAGVTRCAAPAGTPADLVAPSSALAA